MKRRYGIFGIFVLILMSLFMVSCTPNQRAKDFGGTMTYDVSPNEKVVNVTWKDADLWVLTRAMRSDEQAESYYFREKSKFGIMNGTIILKESKVVTNR